jgi:hypothetical protein
VTNGVNNIPRGDAWAFSATRIREDLYRLASILLSARGWEWDPELQELRSEFEQDAIDHTLTSLASRARMLMDQNAGAQAASKLLCGVLLEDAANPSAERPLSLRQACNKIIHAEARHLPEYPDEPVLTGVLQLEGSLIPPRRWRAQVDINKFVLAVLSLTRPLH